jgi:alkylhydroperoxidase/carboxymuconolactone decarboxylase family protein YurZ
MYVIKIINSLSFVSHFVTKLIIAKYSLSIVSLQLTEKAGFILREYVKYSLYDRISTRPFLTDIEKRWIAFQVLYALHQCHKVGVSEMLEVYVQNTVIGHLCPFCLHDV